MSFMDEQVLGYKSPLYGRRTAQFKIYPFSFFECKNMLSGFLHEEQAVLYGVTGGASRINEIATKTGLKPSGCSNQIASFLYGNIGRWWRNNSRKRRQEEINMLSIEGNFILLGKCN